MRQLFFGFNILAATFIEFDTENKEKKDINTPTKRGKISVKIMLKKGL